MDGRGQNNTVLYDNQNADQTADLADASVPIAAPVATPVPAAMQPAPQPPPAPAQTEPTLAQLAAPTGRTPPDTPLSKPRKKWRLFKIAGLIVLGVVLFTGGVLVIGNLNVRQKSSDGQVASRFDNVQMSLNDFASGNSLSLLGNRSLAINGTLRLNDAFIITPQSQPTNADRGQIYYDKGTDQLAYFNGSEFIKLIKGAGTGLTLIDGVISNAGVLSVQGQTGAVTLIAGDGIAIDGTTISNNGVLSVASANANLTVGNDGNGNLTLTSNASVSSPNGTAGKIAKFTGVQTIADSLLSESGTTVTVAGSLSVTGSLSLGTALSIGNGGTGTTTLASNGVIIGHGTSALTSVVASSANQCLVSSATAPAFGSCVTSLNSVSGDLSLANSSASGTTITINDASTSAKGIAQFNGTNFSASSGTINTIQDIATSSSPTFAAVNTNTITPSSTLTVGATGQTLTLQGDALTTLSATNGASKTMLSFQTPTANVTYRLLTAAAGTYDVCTSVGNCSGSSTTLQAAYDASTSPEITVDATRGALTIRDASSAIGANLLEVQNNAGGTTYFGVTSSGISVSGTTTSTGNINSSGGSLQTGGTSRVDSSGNLTNIGNLTATGAITIASTGAGNDVTIDGADQFIVQDAAVFNGAGTFNTDIDLTLADTENLSITNTATGTSAVDLISGVLTNNTTSGTQRGAVIQNAAGTGTTDTLLLLDNADTDTAVTTGLQIASAAGAITTAIDVSDADIVTALSFGANDITGTNFSVTGSSGAIVSAGNITLQGGTVTAGTSSQAGTLVLSDGSSNTGSIVVTALGSDRTYTFPDATGTVCLTTGNCAGSGTGVTTGGGIANRIAKFSAAQNIEVSTISDDGTNVTTSVDLIVQGGDATIGVASSQTGTLNFKHSGSANTGSIVQGALTGSHTYTLPNATGTFCLTTGNCSGSGSSNTLQAAYDAGNTISTTGNDIAFTLNSSQNFTVATAAGATGGTTFSLTDGSNATPPSQLVLVRNNDTNEALTAGLKVTSAAGGITTALDVSDAAITTAIAIGANAITGTNFSVTDAGAVTAVGVNAGAGLLQGALGLTITGAAVSLNASSNFATNINTGTSSGTITLGGGSAPLVIDSTAFDVTSAGALSGITGYIQGSGTFSHTSATATGNIHALSDTALTTGNLLSLTGGTAMTTGSALNIVSGTYVHTAAETGNLINLSYSEATSGAFDTTTNGININSTINTTGSNARTFTGYNYGPTLTACGTTGGTCTIQGFHSYLPALTQSTTNTFNMYGSLMQSSGALVQNTAAGAINWYGAGLETPNITQTTGSVAATGAKIILGSITTGGTQTGVDITGSNSNAAGTQYGVNIANLTAGAATEYAINLGSGWDDLIHGTTAGTNLLNFTNFVVTSGGAITGVGVNAGAGLLQGALGLTVTGAAASLNASSNFATNINAGTSSGTITLGGGSAPLVIDSTALDVTSAGAVSGVTTLATSGIITAGGVGTADNLTYLCRNSSNQIATCNAAGAGAAFVQGGNTFGATATLGTNDANSLELETNNTARLTLGAAGGLTVAANNNLSLASGTGTFGQTYTGTTTDANTITANSLTTASALKVTSSNSSAADTAWSAVQFNPTNAQATTAVTTGTIAGFDLQFTQNPTVAGNTETAANFAIKQNDSSATDSTVTSIINVANNDTATGNQITATDGLKITGSNITNGINLSGTFGTNLITSTNFSVSQAGAIVGVGVNSGTGLVQGTGGITVTGTANINATDTAATNIGNSTGVLTLASGGTSSWTNAGVLTLSATGSGSDIVLTSADDVIVNLADNSLNALDLQESTRNYINISTVNGAEDISFGNASINPTFNFLGTGVATFGGTVAIQGSSALTLGVTGTTTGSVLFKGATAASGAITLIGQANPGTRTITLPDETGTVCTTGSVCTGYAATSGSGSYIQNQNAGQQASSNFWISGTGRADTSFTTPLVDTATAVALAIGTANATAINLNQNTAIAANKTLSMASGTGTFTQAYTGTTSDAHTITASSLTTATALKVTSSNNSAADTAWSGTQINATNAQGTTAVSTGTISGFDLQFTQNTSIAGNTETVANLAVKQNDSSSTDATVASILNLANNDTATGNQITVTDGLKIAGSNVTNGINLSGTFGTNLITASNFIVTQGGSAGLGTTTTTNGRLNVSTADRGVYVTTTGSFSDTSNQSFYAVNAAGTSDALLTARDTDVVTGTTKNLPFYLMTNSAARITMTGGGKVGVNNTDPGAQLHVSSGATDTIAAIVRGASGQTANMLSLQTWDGATATTVFGVTSAGALSLSGTGATTFTTPQSSSVAVKVGIGLYDPAAFGQIMAFGLGSGAASTTRALSLFDNRAGSHQPTLSVFSPDENNSVGFSWNGSNVSAAVQTLSSTGGATTKSIVLQSGNVAGGSSGNSGDVTINSGSTAGGTSGTIYVVSGDAGGTDSTSGGVTIDSGSKSGSGTTGAINIGVTNTAAITMGNSSNNTAITLNSGTGTIAVGTGAQARTINIGTGAAAQTVNLGSATSTSPLTLQAGTGGLVIKPITSSSTAFTLQDSGNAKYMVADTSNVRLYVGDPSADTTGVVLVLDTKSNSGDPTGTDGAMYYNSSMKRMRCYFDASWRFCNDPAGLTWGVNFEDDFLDNTTSDSYVGRGWGITLSGTGSDLDEVASDLSYRPGLVRLATGTATTGLSSMYLNAGGATTNVEPVFVGGGEEIEFAVKVETLATAAQDYKMRIGWCDTDSADCVDGVYFEYDRSTSANWRYATANNSTRTKTSSSTAVTTGWHRFKITVNSAGTSIDFAVDGTSLGTAITTNIPTTSARSTTPSFSIVKTAGTTSILFYVDYYQFRNSLTTAR